MFGFYLSAFHSGLTFKLGALSLGLLAFAVVGWFVLEHSEQSFLFGPAKGMFVYLRRLRKGLSIFPLIAKLRLINENNSEKIVDLALNHPVIRSLQVPSELRRFATIIAEKQPKTVLEIGTCNGGTLLVLCRLAAPRATVISVDLPGGPFGGGYSWFRKTIFKAFPANGQRLHLVQDDSHKIETRDNVSELLGGQKLDLLFIDADHTYEGVRSDFELYSPLMQPGGLIAFHDIAKNQPGEEYGVVRLWNEIKTRYSYSEIIDDPEQIGSGLGLLHL